MKHLGEEEGEEESVSESVRDLPSDAVKELLSEGVSFCNSSSFSLSSFSSANCYFTSHHRYAPVASFASSASKAASTLLLLPFLLSLHSPPPHINFAHFASVFCSSHIIQTTPKPSFKIRTSHFSLLTPLNDTPISSIPFPLKFPSHRSFSAMITLFGYNSTSCSFTFYFCICTCAFLFLLITIVCLRV